MSRHQSGWIEVGEVERALAALRAGEGHPSVRATTLNLVVRCGDAEQLKIAHRVLDRIGSSRPLRAMIVMPATGTPRARVSSDSGSDHRREVFNELVELRGNRVALPSSVDVAAGGRPAGVPVVAGRAAPGGRRGARRR